MPDVSHIVNKIFAHFLKHLKPSHGSEENFSFSPSSIYVSLLSLLPHMGWHKHLLDFLGSDVREIVDNEEELHYFLCSIPRLVIKEHDVTVESFIKFYHHHRGRHIKEIKHRFLELFEHEKEVVKVEEVDHLSTQIHEWAKSKLNIRDLRHFKCGGFHPTHHSIYVANTFHFSACWKMPFDHGQTRLKKFHISSSLTVEVETMHIRRHLRCCVHKEHELSMIELPFQNPRFTALLLHPVHKTRSIWSMLHKFNSLLIEDCISMFEHTEVSLALPRLKFTSHHSILPQLLVDHLIHPDSLTEGSYHLSEHSQAISIHLNEHGISSKVSSRSSIAVAEEGRVERTTFHKLNRPFILVIYDCKHRCPLVVSVIACPHKR